MPDIKATRATAAELKDLESARRGPRAFRWKFDEKVFDGTTYRVEVPTADVASVTNSFRNQCQSVYNRKATVKRYAGKVYVRMVVGEVYNPDANPALFDPIPGSSND